MFIVLFLSLVFLTTGCSKRPEQEIAAARTAVDSAFSDGAEKYAPDEAKQLNEALNAAITEIKNQEARYFKDYKKAKLMLAGVGSDAERIRGILPQRKEEAKIRAKEALNTAISALETAKAAFRKKPTRDAEVTASQESALNELEDALAVIRRLIEAEDFNRAAREAAAVEMNAEKFVFTLKETAGP